MRVLVSRLAIGFLALVVLALPAMAATETVLYSFSDPGEGYPLGTLYFHQGSLYGTGSGDEKTADGQVFRLTNSNGSWQKKPLLTFDGTNGSTPFTGPVHGSGAVFYGTTAYGDAYNGGNVYELYRRGGKWVHHTIWAFGGTSGDGSSPSCDLVMDESGNLYGTTREGGIHNFGVVFELSKSGGVWTETVLHAFDDESGSDGAEPYPGLLNAGPGTFYGTTMWGGQYGNGTVFKLYLSGSEWKEKVVHSFAGGTDGSEPWGTLVKDKNGALYGTTYAGGVSSGYSNVGTVFRLSRSGGAWKEQVIHDFGAEGDGANPLAGLTWGPFAQLYGTTGAGAGIVFELTHSGGIWTETIVHKFGGKGDGGGLQGRVTLDKNGALYGTTVVGGKHDLGTVWEITP